jgi:hypothetical protein
MKINGIQVHAKVTEDAIVGAVERAWSSLDDPGFCILCGAEAGGVEPDARNLTCESCGAEQVFGAAELLMHIVA